MNKRMVEPDLTFSNFFAITKKADRTACVKHPPVAPFHLLQI